MYPANHGWFTAPRLHHMAHVETDIGKKFCRATHTEDFMYNQITNKMSL